MAANQSSNADSKQSLAYMIEALGLEIAAIKKAGGSTSVELFGGTFVVESNGNFIYRFLLAEELQLRDDTPIRVQFAQQEVDGSIVSLSEGVLVLALEQNLGPKLSHIRLVADDSFLVERLRDRLQQVQAGEAHLNMASALRVIGISQIRADKAEVPKSILDGMPRLNEQQVEAVAVSLASDTTFVWGPPGTGKTTVLARIVEAHYLAGRSVLLVSNTNIAVDTAMEKIADRLATDPGFQAGAVLRFGPIVKDELQKKYGEQVILDNVVTRLSQSLQQELSLARAEVGRLSQTVEQLVNMIRQHEQVTAAATDLQHTRESQRQLREKVQSLTNQSVTHASDLESLRYDLTRAKTMGVVQRFFSGLNPEKLRQKVTRLEMLQKATLDAKNAAESEHLSMEGTLLRSEAQLRDLSGRIRDLPPLDQCKAHLATVQPQVKELQERIAELQKQVEQVRQEVISRCRILATTIYRTYLKGQVERPFDVVVIDEASMLMLPMSFFAAGLATQSVTVAGDFRQLPAIVMSDEPLAEEWLKTDVFFKVGIPKQVSTKRVPAYLVALCVQHRMSEAICNVTNRLFYSDHQLVTAASVGTRKSRHMPLGDSHLLYVDTASLHPWAATKLGKYSRYNLLHALLIRKIVVHLHKNGYLSLHDTVNEQIGAVSPYAAQTHLIQALLEDAMGKDARHFAATVHRFQGNEKDTMLVDLTDSTGCRLGKFMKGVVVEDAGSRLLNVAISRARDHVILVANFEYLRTNATADSIVVHLLDLFQEHGTPLDLEAVLPLGDDDWIDGLHKIIPPDIALTDGQCGIFTEVTFYPAFARDIEAAKESIVLLSPFLTSRGTARWADHFYAAMKRGVHLHIVTRPSTELGGASEEEVTETIKKLREMGVVVDLRRRMHEKVAVIDQKTAWHGSLNILSHRNTTERMLRLTGEAVCHSLSDLISPWNRKRDETRTPTDAENPVCPKCGMPSVLLDGRFGIYFECSNCKTKIDPRRRSSSRKADKPVRKKEKRSPRPVTTATQDACPLPGCNGHLVEKNGRYGPFLGCSNYPRCRHTQDR